MLGSHEGGNERYIEGLYKNLTKRKIKTFILRKNWLGSNLLRLLIQIPFFAYKNKVNIVHSTYIGPLFNVCKSIVTVHDLSFKKYPEFFNLKDRFIFNIFFPLSLKNASAIITPSEFTKNELIKYYPKYKEKIFKTYYGVDGYFKKIKSGKIKGRYLLTVNSKNRRKNINNTLKAFCKLDKEVNAYKLIVIGGRKNISSKYLNNKKIIYYDYISETELRWLYNNCKIFISNSLYEGFDFPILEALKCGAFVIASDIKTHKEITKNTLKYVNSSNYLDLYNKLKYYLTRPYLINKKLKETENVVKIYTWKKSIDQTLRVYDLVLKK